jgi:hypothetical protein
MRMGKGQERGFMLVPEAWLMSSVSAPFMAVMPGICMPGICIPGISWVWPAAAPTIITMPRMAMGILMRAAVKMASCRSFNYTGRVADGCPDFSR